MAKRDIYQEVTDKILAMLEAGTVPWHKPWDAAPRNFASDYRYRGINIWLLYAPEYRQPAWMTYKQARQLGGHVRKGEKGSHIIYWDRFMKEVESDGDTELKTIPFMKVYTVFNVEQCEDIEIEAKEVVELASAEAIVSDYDGCPEIKRGGDVAAYGLSNDVVYIPHPEAFDVMDGYYSVLFHELAHSTGHESRLSRDMKTWSNDMDAYSEEELVAEMGSAMLCATSDIDLSVTIENAAAYIDHWRRKVSEDKRLVVRASSKAQKAVDWIVGRRDND
jgi:antirestriction protein ArdC